jgi:hypothetical protein
MAKVMNTVFGIGIAVILFILVMLGTQVFYKEPMVDGAAFNCTYLEVRPVYFSSMESCYDNMTVRECRDVIKNQTIVNDADQKKVNDCWQRFNDAQKVYGKNLFIINSIVGIILVILSLFLFSMTNIAAGSAFAGLALIIYGFMRGWQGTGDVLKFIVALFVAILFIVLAVIVNKRYYGHRKGR